MLNSTIFVCLALFLFSQVLFLVNIQYPKGHNFDEYTYVPAAIQFLQMKNNQNMEHPPLAKLLMAAGIKFFGDQPLGWRYMSTLFGSLTLVGMYLWALALFRDQKTAIFAALITVVNQLLYVQARIGMLDIFMFAFTVFALAAFCAAWSIKVNGRKAFYLLLFGGVMFGLAIACKWSAIVPWLSAMLMIVVVKLMQNWNTVFPKASLRKAVSEGSENWYSPQLLGGISIVKVVVALVIVPIFVYFLTFLPFLFIQRNNQNFYSILDLISMQIKMWNDQQRIVTQHPYMSKWLGWPLMIRPIWYAFDKEVDNFCRCVVMLGNPIVMWGGLIALVSCIWAWLARRSREAFLILSFYCAFYFGWAFITRKMVFFYYYYPAGMTLSMAIAFFFRYWESGKGSFLRKIRILRWTFLALCIGFFIYFYPVLAALKIPSNTLHYWMWFRAWI